MEEFYRQNMLINPIINNSIYIKDVHYPSSIYFEGRKKNDKNDSFLNSQNGVDNNKDAQKQLVIKLADSKMSIQKIAQTTNLKRKKIIQILNQYFKEKGQGSGILTQKTTPVPKDIIHDYDNSMEKILSSSYQKILQYIDQVKQEVSEIIQQPFACEMDLEIKIQNLERIKQEVVNKSLEYIENKKETKVLQTLLAHIDTKIRKVSSQIQKLEKMKGSSSIPNVTWLTQEDFNNKLLGHQRFINMSLIAHCEKSEIEAANNNLKLAYPEECVILIDPNNYDTQNTNDRDKQKYTIYGRFYESHDGRKYGQFGTKKLFVIEFLSNYKDVYKNFIVSLIKNKSKIVGA